MSEFHLDTSGAVERKRALGEPEGPCTWAELDAFTQGYIEALFFTEEDALRYPDTGPGVGGGDYGFALLAPDALASILADCTAFQSRMPETLDIACNAPGYDETRAGRDFWFTRNGHGVGFWDRAELDFSPPAFNGATVGDSLTRAAKRFGEVNAHLGDDGMVYL